MGQRFASREKFEFANGAIGYAPGGPMDCLGPYAKVTNCPIDDTSLRLTCYATSYADTYFSIPAYTRYRGKYIKGYFTSDNSVDGRAIKFVPMSDYLPRLKEAMPNQWEVIVGNVGSVYRGICEETAKSYYLEYVNTSKLGIGRAGNEDVTLLENDNIVAEFIIAGGATDDQTQTN